MPDQDPNPILHVMELARLQGGAGEIETFQAQIARILTFFEILNEVDARHVEPLDQISDFNGPLREDKIKPSWGRSSILSNATQVKEGFYQVPRILR